MSSTSFRQDIFILVCPHSPPSLSHSTRGDMGGGSSKYIYMTGLQRTLVCTCCCRARFRMPKPSSSCLGCSRRPSMGIPCRARDMNVWRERASRTAVHGLSASTQQGRTARLSDCSDSSPCPRTLIVMRDKFWHFDHQFQKRGEPCSLPFPNLSGSQSRLRLPPSVVRALRYCAVLFEIKPAADEVRCGQNIAFSNTDATLPPATLRGRTNRRGCQDARSRIDCANVDTSSCAHRGQVETEISQTLASNRRPLLSIARGLTVMSV